MDPVTLITIFNLIAPQVFQLIGNLRQKDPTMTYQQALEMAGVKLDAEYAQLLADMAQAVKEGAVPRTPSP